MLAPMDKSFIVRCAGLVLGLLGAWTAYTQTPQQGKQPAAKGKQPAPFNLIKVADDLYVIDGGGAGNVAVYLTDEGVILVDDKYEQHFDEIMLNVRKVTQLPVKYVINTHYHADHSGGNTHFAPITQVISTTMARRNIVNKVQPGAPANMIPASVTFSREMSVFLGGKEVRALHLGRGHTNTDAFVYFPALRTIHTGDLVTSGQPLIDYAGGGSIVEWTKTLDAAMSTVDFETMIPGHGPVGTKAAMLTYRNNAESLRTRVSAEIRAGKTEAEVAAFLTAQFNWQPGGLQLERGLKGMMVELK